MGAYKGLLTCTFDDTITWLVEALCISSLLLEYQDGLSAASLFQQLCATPQITILSASVTNRSLACDTSFNSYAKLPAIEGCQEAGKAAYCWPPNGTRICLPNFDEIPFYWPAAFYNTRAYFYIDYNDQHSQGPNQPGGIDVVQMNTDLTGFEQYAKPIPGRSNEKSLSITIREWYPYMDSMREAVHQGPTLILVAPEVTATATSTATAAAADGSPDFPPGKIAGISFGAFVGAVLLGMLAYSCCATCCMSCCGFQQKSETRRVRRLQARRIQPDVEAIKASVAAGKIWPGHDARSQSVGTDEISAVDAQRVEVQRPEIARLESKPPAYEAAPPPKYTP